MYKRIMCGEKTSKQTNRIKKVENKRTIIQANKKNHKKQKQKQTKTKTTTKQTKTKQKVGKRPIVKSSSEPKTQRKTYHLKDTSLLCDL